MGAGGQARVAALTLSMEETEAMVGMVGSCSRRSILISSRRENQMTCQQ